MKVQGFPEGVGQAIGAGMLASAVSLYARWWQLETWLRELVYVELRARDGIDWHDQLGVNPNRQAREEVANLSFRY
jgi:hypothetical protein